MTKPTISADSQEAGTSQDQKADGEKKPVALQIKEAAAGPVVPNVLVTSPENGDPTTPTAARPAIDPKPVIDSTLVGKPQGSAREPAERKDQPVTATQDTKPTATASPFAAKETPVAPAPTQVVEVRKAGFMPMFLGGVIAAALGAGATYWAIPQLPPAWQPALPANESNDPQAQLDASRQAATEAAQAEVQAARQGIIDAATQAADKVATEVGHRAGTEAAQDLLAQAATTAPDQPASSAVSPALAGLSDQLQDQAQRITKLDQTLAALTAAGATTPPAPSTSASTAGDLAQVPAPQPLQALQTELAQLREQVQNHDIRLAELAEQPEIDPQTLQELQSLNQHIASLQEKVQSAATAAEERIEQTRADAATVQQETQDIMRRTSIAAIAAGLKAALETGGSLQGGLSDLQASGVTLPDALGGDIPTLPYLQREFEDAARAGLRASLREQSGSDDTLGAIGNFLRVQTGARSVEPKGGTDPDAILSRAAAKVRSGDLQTALQEIQTLPASGQQAMSGWTTDATRWVAAREAISGLSNSVK